MSLIQEALKRQRDDSAGGNAAQPAGSAEPMRAPGPPPLVSTIHAPELDAAAGAPADPPPLPYQTFEEPEVKSRSWVTLVGVVMLALLLGGGGVCLLVFAFQKWGVTKAVPTALAVTPVVATATPVAPSAAVPSPAVSAPIASASPPASVATAAGKPGLDATPPVAWPYLYITGIAGKGIHGAASINGKVLSVGEFVDGAEVLSVADNGVKLEFGGESRFIRIGAGAE